MTAPETARLSFIAACLLSLACLGVSIWNTRNLTFAPPDAEHYGIVARSLLRGQGYTENFVPFHPGTYASVRHVPEIHGLLRPLVLVPLFLLLGVGPFALRIPDFVYAALTGLTVFWWARRVVGNGPALLACALTLLNVELLYDALLATDDVGFAFFFTLTLALLHRALSEGGDREFLLAGVAAGLALLEKPSGFFIPAVFLVAVWRFGGSELRDRARRLGLLLAPFLAAASAYFVRNVAYGTPQFRFGVLVWAYKVGGYEGWTRLFDPAPSLLGMLRAIGWRRVVTVVAAEMGKFLDFVLPLRVLAAGKLPGLSVESVLPLLALGGALVCRRRMAALVWLGAASLVSSVGFICVLWHFQPRYFSLLVPLCGLLAAGLFASGARHAGRGWWGRLVRSGSLLAAAGVVAAAGLEFAVAQGNVGLFPDLLACRRALAWLAANTGPEERIMTLDPWSLSWTADREAIMIPSGGAQPIAVVARRYGAHWMLAYETALRPITGKLVMAMDGSAVGLRLTRRYDDGTCHVERLDWEPDGNGP